MAHAGYRRGRRAVPSRPPGRALDILELRVFARRRDERRAGVRPFVGRSRSWRHFCVRPRRRPRRPGENEWPVLLPAATRGTAAPAPTLTVMALGAPPPGAPTCWTPASC